jgi:REP element-mobilizing transposase RayT
MEQLGQLFYNGAMHDREEKGEPVVFGTFDPAAEVEVTERNLPHWFQPGAAMFVTFRAADSLPRDVILRWRRELEQWLAIRGLPKELAESTVHRRLQNHDALLNELNAAESREFKRLADRLFHRSLDECHGACLLRRPELAKIVGDAVLFYRDTKYDLDRFVVMPNHVHAIVQFRTGANLKTVSESWMRFTARKINAATGGTGAFWQPEPFDHIIRGPEQFAYLQNYTADNPEKANLRPGEYLYWERV